MPLRNKKWSNNHNTNENAKWLFDMFVSKQFDFHDPPTAKSLEDFYPAIRERFAVYNQKGLNGHIKKIANDAEIHCLKSQQNGIDEADDNEENKLDNNVDDNYVKTMSADKTSDDEIIEVGKKSYSFCPDQDDCEVILPYEIWSWKDDQSRL